jgi:hypothetical protein
MTISDRSRTFDAHDIARRGLHLDDVAAIHPRVARLDPLFSLAVDRDHRHMRVDSL